MKTLVFLTLGLGLAIGIVLSPGFTYGTPDTGAPDIGAPDTGDSGAQAGITICHCPPRNPDNCHTITINPAALPAHLAHGDTIGPCPEQEVVNIIKVNRSIEDVSIEPSNVPNEYFVLVSTSSTIYDNRPANASYDFHLLINNRPVIGGVETVVHESPGFLIPPDYNTEGCTCNFGCGQGQLFVCEHPPSCTCSDTNTITALLPFEPILLGPDDVVSVLIVPHEGALREVVLIDDRMAVQLDSP